VIDAASAANVASHNYIQAAAVYLYLFAPNKKSITSKTLQKYYSCKVKQHLNSVKKLNHKTKNKTKLKGH